MRRRDGEVILIIWTALALFAVTAAPADDAQWRGGDDANRTTQHDHGRNAAGAVQLGPRPFYLVQGMDDGPLKSKLMRCENGPFRRSDFSIAHRGAPLQFPEHTREAYEAGACMGAGVVECDVTFTRDGELVCRHDECDLHTTTNIVNTELNAACARALRSIDTLG